VQSIDDELKKLPPKPGVYLMHDSKDEIIYVGKAINLKNRVRQYFQKGRNITTKIEQMVLKIKYFEYIVTDSEIEALILECNLIKEHRPRYNTMLKDDKGYPYIKVNLNEEFPRISFTREIKKDNAKYFGPYISAGAVKDTLELLRKIYKIRTCNRVLPRDIGKERPCLNYQIKQCLAPCQGYVNQDEYRKSIDSIVSFLSGNYKEVLKMLETKMKNASENMEYEEAAEFRDLLNNVRKIAIKQKVEFGNSQDKDVIAYALEDQSAVVQVFFIRNGKLLGREHFYLRISSYEKESQILESFIKQYYAGTPFIPGELLLQDEVEDEQVISDWLSSKRGAKVVIRKPIKGEKEKLVELARTNAIQILSQDKEKLKIEEMRTVGALREIETLLSLDSLSRIESFDISNISGYDNVGSMVVYENGKPRKNDYRKFKIKWVKGPDDYLSMEEMLTRRFSHGIDDKFSKLPNLILMDGGKGQVNIALKVLGNLGLDIPVCGMVKDDNHRTRGLYFNNYELPINVASEGFKLITRIQDETHRFAIEYHRNLRSKGQVHSILDDIEGIGPKRRRELMKTLKSLDNIKAATMEELAEIPTMNEAAAKKVYEFFH